MTSTPSPNGFPRIGLGLPTLGRHAGPESLELLATAADRLGFHSVGVSERILVPAGPDWTNDFGLPEEAAYDALETLTWVAARTRGVRLRSDVIVPLFQQPIVLARRLATLDVLSGGRVDAGLAIGWLPQEFEATGVPLSGRAAAFEEAVAAMRACWGPDPVEFTGERYRVPIARVTPKPLSGSVAIHVGGVVRPAIERAARIGDGVTLACRDWESMSEQIGWYRAAGGDGTVVVKGGPMIAMPGAPEPPKTWSTETIADDLRRAASLGVDEVVWDLNVVDTPPAEQVAAFERLAAQAGLKARG